MTTLIFGGVVCAALANEGQDLSATGETSSNVRAGVKPGMRLILMSNGQVKPGEVEEVEDGFIVRRHSARMKLPKDQILFVGDTLEDLYQYKVSRFPPQDIGEQRNLINWCRQNGLDSKIDGAVEQILKADPANPYAIALSKERNKKRNRQEEVASTASPNARSTARPIDYGEFLKSIEQGCGSESIKSYNKLEIHLLRSCANAGCHGNVKYDKGFQLFQKADTRLTTFRLTGRNLYSLTQSINIDDPNTSPVLVMALKGRGHANLSSPPFASVSDPRYRQLHEWVFDYAAKQGSKTILAQGARAHEESLSKSKRDFGGDRHDLSSAKIQDSTPGNRILARPGDDMGQARPGLGAMADDAPPTPTKKAPAAKPKPPAGPKGSNVDPFEPTEPTKKPESSEEPTPEVKTAPAPTIDPKLEKQASRQEKAKRSRAERTKDPLAKVQLPSDTTNGDPFEAAPFSLGARKSRNSLEHDSPGVKINNTRKSLGREARATEKKDD